MFTDFRLSPHFKASEFLTNTWREKYIPENVRLGLMEPNVSNMRELCNEILEPLRAHFGSPVIVSSGFRYSAFTNGKWDGLDVAIRKNKSKYLPKSQHCRGEAADIHVVGVKDRDVWEWIWKHSPYPFGQVILEHGLRSVWTHVSIDGNYIKERGGGRIYGQVQDAVEASNGSFRYKTIARVNRW